MLLLWAVYSLATDRSEDLEREEGEERGLTRETVLASFFPSTLSFSHLFSVCTHACTHHVIHTEVRGQLCGVLSCLYMGTGDPTQVIGHQASPFIHLTPFLTLPRDYFPVSNGVLGSSGWMVPATVPDSVSCIWAGALPVSSTPGLFGLFLCLFFFLFFALLHNCVQECMPQPIGVCQRTTCWNQFSHSTMSSPPDQTYVWQARWQVPLCAQHPLQLISFLRWISHRNYNSTIE